jgi:hypothetical protein
MLLGYHFQALPHTCLLRYQNTQLFQDSGICILDAIHYFREEPDEPASPAPNRIPRRGSMDVIDQLRVLSARIATTKDIVQTEEATKNAMVMPFIQLLGYNVFDPLEVTPELIADIGTKKGEKGLSAGICKGVDLTGFSEI